MFPSEDCRIAAAMHESSHAGAAHPVLTIDGVPLDQWIGRRANEPEVPDLVPAQGWLTDEADLALAWRRIESSQESCSTIVPLLICPDDADLNCSVLVAEQECTGDHIVWHRFGFAFDLPGDQVGATVKWFGQGVVARFPRPQFAVALAEFRRLVDAGWR